MINNKIISGFPAIGKSHLFKNNHELLILDSDSSKFSWVSKDIRNPDFPNNYIEHIQSWVNDADVILVSSHKVVRDALRLYDLDYTLVYPDRSLKSEYMQRLRDRGSSEGFIEMIDLSWDGFIDELELEAFPKKIKLNSGEYLSDVL